MQARLQLRAVEVLSKFACGRAQSLVVPAGEPVSVDKRKAHFSSANVRRSAYFETDKVCICMTAPANPANQCMDVLTSLCFQWWHASSSV